MRRVGKNCSLLATVDQTVITTIRPKPKRNIRRIPNTKPNENRILDDNLNCTYNPKRIGHTCTQPRTEHDTKSVYGMVGHFEVLPLSLRLYLSDRRWFKVTQNKT